MYPQTDAEWQAEFNKYRHSPELRKVNSRMTLEEFKFIFIMEYVHRMWGRALGAVFALPAAALLITGHIRAPLAARLAVLFAMGGAQVCPLPPCTVPAVWLLHYRSLGAELAVLVCRVTWAGGW